ncbi:hypothetical protein [Streptomyces atratus]|uniref:hypothetical protein n=1 Tax=Streptomyces atratus TaxID=1893 RepID=UPI00364A0900
MDGIDPFYVAVGDVVKRAWDEDPNTDSCHCAFRVEVKEKTQSSGEANTEWIAAHDLQAGDIIRRRRSRPDNNECHCDFDFKVERKN